MGWPRPSWAWIGQHHCQDRPRPPFGRPPLDLRGQSGPLSAACGVRQHLTQGARCHAPSRDDLPGCGEHACGSVRRPEPRAERWRLAVRGQSRSSSFHPSTVSMIWQKAKVQRWVDQTKQPCLVAQEAQTARNQTEGWRCKKRKQHARKTPRNHGRCTIRSHVLMSLSTVVFASVVRCASRSFL